MCSLIEIRLGIGLLAAAPEPVRGPAEPFATLEAQGGGRGRTASRRARIDGRQRRPRARLSRFPRRDRADRPPLGRRDPLGARRAPALLRRAHDAASPASPTGCSRAACASSRPPGLVERSVHDGTPARVSYALTEKGRSLEPVLGELEDWARAWKLSS